MNKIAFVIPWYGLNIPGGSESACRNIAERIAMQGEQVEVLTTCVKQFDSNWNHNFYDSGVEQLTGVVVRRFKVKNRDVKKFDQINIKLINNDKVTYKEEQIFLKEMINSSDLESYISDNKEDYKAIIFIPYMFGTTYHGIQHSLDNAILLPAFHDESYAYFESFRQLYSKVEGMIFFSEAEKEWANSHYDLKHVKQRVLGLGIEGFSSNSERFKQKYRIQSPFILYAGRKDHGKNVHTLLELFSQFHSEVKSQVKLVLIGGGQIEIPTSIKDDVIDLGFVSEQDKYDAYAAADVFCNPSANESFSIVIMESWYAGTPVLVFEKSHVTKRFCEDSNGGLYFGNYNEFKACLNLLLSNGALANSLGINGQKFVKSNFNWNEVTKRYIQFINECSGGIIQ